MLVGSIVSLNIEQGSFTPSSLLSLPAFQLDLAPNSDAIG